MSYESEHIEALNAIANVLENLLIQMRRSEAAKLQRHSQLLATLRTLKPKEAQGE